MAGPTPITFPAESGVALVAQSNPGVAAWSASGRVLIESGSSSATVTGLPVSLAGKPVLVTWGSGSDGNAIFGVGSITAGPTSATLSIELYDAAGTVVNALADVNMNYLVLG